MPSFDRYFSSNSFPHSLQLDIAIIQYPTTIFDQARVQKVVTPVSFVEMNYSKYSHSIMYLTTCSVIKPVLPIQNESFLVNGNITISYFFPNRFNIVSPSLV